MHVGVWKQMGLPLSCGEKVLARDIALRQNQLVLAKLVLVSGWTACKIAQAVG